MTQLFLEPSAPLESAAPSHRRQVEVGNLSPITLTIGERVEYHPKLPDMTAERCDILWHPQEAPTPLIEDPHRQIGSSAADLSGSCKGVGHIYTDYEVHFRIRRVFNDNILHVLILLRSLTVGDGGGGDRNGFHHCCLAGREKKRGCLRDQGEQAIISKLVSSLVQHSYSHHF